MMEFFVLMVQMLTVGVNGITSTTKTYLEPSFAICEQAARHAFVVEKADHAVCVAAETWKSTGEPLPETAYNLAVEGPAI